MMKNVVKITSGTLRGRAITTPGGKTHPMGERERLALFNMIADAVPGAVVLDAYAGSGALGIEALSRGARAVVFVEKSSGAARVINENLQSLGIDGEVVTAKIPDYEPNTLFDVVLADPPYDSFNLTEVAQLGKYVNKNGILVLSHPGEAPEIPGTILRKSHKYAGATISIYDKSN